MARHKINNALKSLGWELDDDNRNVFFESEINKIFPKLGKKRPDYVLVDNHKKPLAVIEAKAANLKFKRGLEQATEYAKIINAPLVFVSNGISHIARTKDGKFVTRDYEVVDELLSEKDILSFIKYKTITTPDATLKSQAALIKKYNEAAKILRSEGIPTGIESFYEFCIFLFIKLATESGIVSRNYSFDTLTDKVGDQLKEHYLAVVEYFREKYRDVFREVKIEKSETIEKLVRLIKDSDLSATAIDIKGGAYEYFLSKYSKARKNDLGQYFTPRHIVKMMIHILGLDNTKKETIYDPFCGTGGMLVYAFREMYDGADKNDAESIKHLKTRTFFGGDNTKELSQIARMNMILIGDGSTNIKRQDSLSAPIFREYDVVITNIPFNLSSVDINIAEKYTTDETDANVICIRHCLESLKPNGRGAMILPESIAYADKYERVRKYLIKHCNIKSIIRLPRPTFVPYTSARTFIIHFDKAHQAKTKKLYIVDIENDGFSAGAWRESIDKNDIPDFILKADSIEAHYKSTQIEEMKKHIFFMQGPSMTIKDGIRLRDLIDVKTQKQKLKPNEYYNQPRISSHTNTISKLGEPRLGKNIKEESKILIAPGDVVIATLHTQSGNGLFGISDGHYIATSQIVATIKENVNRDWLVLMLQNILPKLETSDLVNRETYKRDDILNLILPKPPSYKTLKKFSETKSELEKKIRESEEALQTLKNEMVKEAF